MIKVNILIGFSLELETIEKLTNDLGRFVSHISLINLANKANAKSLINLLAIGILSLEELIFEIDGQDEEKAKIFINDFFKNI